MSITRREFLRYAAGIGLYPFAPLVIDACAVLPPPTSKPATLQPVEFELSKETLQRMVGIAVDDYNRVLEQNIDKAQARAALELVPTLSEYQNILRSIDPSYIPQSELNHPAISYHDKIYVYKESFDYHTRGLPKTEIGKQAKEEFLEWLLVHELAHWSATEYESSQLQDLVYNVMFANSQAFKGKNVIPAGVKGAKIFAVVDGVGKSTFSNEEEAEAVLLGNTVMALRGKPKLIRDYPAHPDASAAADLG